MQIAIALSIRRFCLAKLDGASYNDTTVTIQNDPLNIRVAMISKALVHGAYQRKAEEMARLGVDLSVFVPPSWNDDRGSQQAEERFTAGYEYRTIPIRFNGRFHIHHYPTLPQELDRLHPDIVHIDEEPYNLMTWLAARAAKQAGAVSTFFTWQNIARNYPPPFRWFEQSNYRHTPIAIAGSQDAADVLQAKGYGGEIAVIPQFGVDPLLFAPEPKRSLSHGEGQFRIGYAGGLLPEKGLELLLQGCAQLQEDWQLQLIGEGEVKGVLIELVQQLGIRERVHFEQRVDSADMPAFYRGLDLFVLPSQTTPSWKEQFGRVLIEAMACGVPVIGSDSGEIPNVIGDAGLIFPEGDPSALGAQMTQLQKNPQLCRDLAQKGRQRVLSKYTMTQIAQQTVDVYRRLISSD